MKLERLKIQNFRNLRDFEITFTGSATDADGTERVFKSHAVIGQNGSGKSNMIEAIVTIFRDLDLNQPASLDYELDYEVRGIRIQIRANAGVAPNVTIDGELEDAWVLSDTHHPEKMDTRDPERPKPLRGSARRYLPSHVFTYYSGKNERLEALFQQHQKNFIDRLHEDPTGEVDEEELASFSDSDGLLRRMFYCRHPHSRLVLLACLLAPEKPLKGVLDNLRIDGIDSALFALKQPYRLTGDVFSEDDINAGDKRFWYDQTRFSQEFLDKLWELSTAPIDFTEEKVIDFRGRTEEQALLYLFVDGREKLDELREHIGDSYRFFRFLEGSYIADLLDDLKIFVKHRNAEGLVTFEALSEGELQLLTVLGLMRLTHQDHCLFLLDEPDTHLNPMWKLIYFEQIETVLKQSPESILQGDSQIIVTTHDPMMIGGLRKEQVRVMRNGPNGSTVDEIDEHPQGMGVAGLLKSEYFGLPTTLDSDTLAKLQKRNELLAKRKKESLSGAEEALLSKLQNYLEDLGFSKVSRDPLYQLFIEKMYEVRSQPLNEFLNPVELAARESQAMEIVSEIVKRERTDGLSDLARELSLQLKK
ncbi:MAG: AAA family ATPase [Verrucomicrobiota bacterium]